MTSSNDNKDSSLPRAASRLVLYTNLKKEEGMKSNGQRKGEERAEEKRKLKVKEEGEF